MYFAIALKRDLAKLGYDLQTDDINSPKESSISIYLEMPKRGSLFPKPTEKSKSHVILWESELIRPDNWLEANHAKFATVFTWHDDYVARPATSIPTNYVKSNFALKLPPEPNRTQFENRKLIAMISGNKANSHPLELYSARRNFIKWAEENIEEDFDYYGVGWDRPYLQGGLFHKSLRRLGLLQLLPQLPSVCYRGTVKEKNATLSQYKFSYCFENGRDIPGYITEKILDSMFAGCVPVYWGAPNIDIHIPKDCFIDYREFLDQRNPDAAMVKFLKGVSKPRWNSYQEAISDFLSSEKSDSFNADWWAQMVMSHVV